MSLRDLAWRRVAQRRRIAGEGGPRYFRRQREPRRASEFLELRPLQALPVERNKRAELRPFGGDAAQGNQVSDFNIPIVPPDGDELG